MSERNSEEITEREQWQEPMLDDAQMKKSMNQSIKDLNARQLMAMALIRTGMPRHRVCTEAGITSHQYNNVYKRYEAGNFDKISTELMENWENILRAKLMNVSEVALDKILSLMDEGSMKDAKLASGIFSEVFDKFRLSTGKSTENIETTTLRLSEMIESRTGLQKPNQSQYHENITPVNTAPPSLTEVI